MNNSKSTTYLFVLNSVIVAFIMAIILIIQNYFPIQYIFGIIEDSFGEDLTFVFYLTSSFLIAWSLWIEGNFKKYGYVALCLGMFFIAMEEISWGQRILGITAPSIVSKLNYQSEFTIHNMYIFPKEQIFYYLIMIWVFIFPFLSSKIHFLGNLFKKINMPYVPIILWPYFFISFINSVVKPFAKGDEVGEALFGLSFLLFAIFVFNRTVRECGINVFRIRRMKVGVVLVMILLSVVLFRMKPQKEAYKFYFHLFAEELYPEKNMNVQAKKTFQYIFDHPEVIRDETLFNYGDFLLNIKDQDAQAVLSEVLEQQREISRRKPDKPKPHIVSGRIYKKLVQNSLAEKEFRIALTKAEAKVLSAEKNWEKSKAFKTIGDINYELGNKAVALEYFHKAYDVADPGWGRRNIEQLIQSVEKE